MQNTDAQAQQAHIRNFEEKFKLDLEEARLLHEGGSFTKAEALYQKLLQIAPENAELLHLFGALLLQTGQKERAESMLQLACTKAVGEPRYLNTLGLLYRHTSRVEEALITLTKAVKLAPDYAEAYSNRGLVYLQINRLKNALKDFKKATELEPGNPELWTNYGFALQDAGEVVKAHNAYQKAVEIAPNVERYLLNLAAVAFNLNHKAEAIALYTKILKQNPEEPTAKHLMASLQNSADAHHVPEAYISKLFDQYAPQFDAHLKKLGYYVPERLAELIPALFVHQGDAQGVSLLDLGCGTGACGQLFKEKCVKITGVDISRKMLAEAEKSNAYTALYCLGLLPYLKQEKGVYTLVFAADVFVYVGALEAIFKEVTRVLAPQGLFAFSIECATTDEGAKKGYTLRQSGRFAHTHAYIKTLAQTHNMAVEVAEDITVRKEREAGIPGCLYILRR